MSSWRGPGILWRKQVVEVVHQEQAQRSSAHLGQEWEAERNTAAISTITRSIQSSVYSENNGEVRSQMHRSSDTTWKRKWVSWRRGVFGRWWQPSRAVSCTRESIMEILVPTCQCPNTWSEQFKTIDNTSARERHPTSLSCKTTSLISHRSNLMLELVLN